MRLPTKVEQQAYVKRQAKNIHAVLVGVTFFILVAFLGLKEIALLTTILTAASRLIGVGLRLLAESDDEPNLTITLPWKTKKVAKRKKKKGTR